MCEWTAVTAMPFVLSARQFVVALRDRLAARRWHRSPHPRAPYITSFTHFERFVHARRPRASGAVGVTRSAGAAYISRRERHGRCNTNARRHGAHPGSAGPPGAGETLARSHHDEPRAHSTNVLRRRRGAVAAEVASAQQASDPGHDV